MNRTILMMFLLIGCVGSTQADVTESSRLGTLSFVLENDLFYDVDRHYTNGVGFIWVPDRSAPTPTWAKQLAGLLPWFPDQGELRHGYAFGQSMFTPNDITVADPPLTERPYAGWLYGTLGIGRGSGTQLDLLALSLGMVGPASLAEQSQKFVHKVIGSPEPQGWSTQIGNEPGFVLTYQRSWRGLAQTKIGSVSLDLTPHVGAAIGNVFTYANTGVTLRLGERLPKDFGPPRIQPGLFGSGEFTPIGDFDWYLFAGVEERGVVRNIFLDGNSFRDSRSVDKYPWVNDLQYGFVFDWPDIRLSYTHVKRGREYQSQGTGDNFGALTVSIKF
jgi:hypothetical protein